MSRSQRRSKRGSSGVDADGFGTSESQSTLAGTSKSTDFAMSQVSMNNSKVVPIVAPQSAVEVMGSSSDIRSSVPSQASGNVIREMSDNNEFDNSVVSLVSSPVSDGSPRLFHETPRDIQVMRPLYQQRSGSLPPLRVASKLLGTGDYDPDRVVPLKGLPIVSAGSVGPPLALPLLPMVASMSAADSISRDALPRAATFRLQRRALAPIRDRAQLARMRTGLQHFPSRLASIGDTVPSKASAGSEPLRLGGEPSDHSTYSNASAAVPMSTGRLRSFVDLSSQVEPAPPATITKPAPIQRQRSMSESALTHEAKNTTGSKLMSFRIKTGNLHASTFKLQAAASARKGFNASKRTLKRLSTKLIRTESEASLKSANARSVAPSVVSRLGKYSTALSSWLQHTRAGRLTTSVYDNLASCLSPVSSVCARIMDALWFDKFIFICIVLNSISIASYHYRISPPFELALQIVEFLFALVFILELLVKVFGLGGLRAYLQKSRMNVFDCLIVVATMPSVIAPIVTLSFTQTGALASTRVFRLFRVLRIARLLLKIKSMRALLGAVMGSMVPILNLLFFNVFTMVTMAIAMTSLFARPNPPSPDLADATDVYGNNLYATGQQPRYNFDNFFNSLVSLFIIMSGELTYVFTVVLLCA